MLKNRVLSFVALVLMIFIGFKEISSYQLNYIPNRFIAVYTGWSETFSAPEFTVELGKIDRLQDIESGLEMAGWVSREIDEIYVIGGDLQSNLVSRILVLPRPDVAQYFDNDTLHFSGFEIVLDGIRLNEVNCVVAAGASGYQVLFSDSLCAELLG
jgi:hypothetical protein